MPGHPEDSVLLRRTAARPGALRVLINPGRYHRGGHELLFHLTSVFIFALFYGRGSCGTGLACVCQLGGIFEGLSIHGNNSTGPLSPIWSNPWKMNLPQPSRLWELQDGMLTMDNVASLGSISFCCRSLLPSANCRALFEPFRSQVKEVPRPLLECSPVVSLGEMADGLPSQRLDFAEDGLLIVDSSLPFRVYRSRVRMENIYLKQREVRSAPELHSLSHKQQAVPFV